MTAKQVTVRISAEGGQQVKAEFQGIGAAAAAAMKLTETANKNAAASAAVFEAAIEAEAAAFQQLRAQLDPTVAAQQRLAQQTEVVRRAVQMGAVTQAEATRTLSQAQAQYRASVAALDGFGTQMGRVGGSSRQLGYALQNTGYQVGDFFVQIAAGTDASRALAMQLPQLLGGFGVAGAIIGAVVAAGGALAPMFMDAEQKIEKTSVSIGSLSGALDELGRAEKRYADLLSARRLTQSSVSDAAIALMRRELEAKRALFNVERIQMKMEADALRASLATRQAAYDAEVRDLMAITAGGARVSDGEVERGATNDAMRVRAEGLAEMRAQGLEIQKQQAELTLIEVTLARINEAFTQGAAILSGQSATAEDVSTQVEKQAAAIKRQYEYLGRSRSEQAEVQRSAKEMLAALQAEADLRAIVVRHGEGSRQAVEARLSAERAAFNAQVEAMEVAEAFKSELMSAWDAANGVASVDIAGNVHLAAAAASDLAANLESALVRLSSIRDAAVTSAQQRAELARARLDTVGNPVARAGAEAVINYRHASGIKDGGYSLLRDGNIASFERLSGRMAQDEAQVRKAAEAAAQLEAPASAADAAWRKLHDKDKKGGGGKGKSEKEGIGARTEALLAEARVIAEANAAGKDYTRALKVQREEHQLILEAQRAKVALTPAVLASIKAEAEAYVAAEEALERIRTATDRGQDAMKGLFGAMLDGADAAKKAMIDLLAEMARVQFIKGMMGLLGGTSWGGKLVEGVGNLLSFDGGGDTPYGPRSGGLDGKGGFLAMLHPRETVVDHTKSTSSRPSNSPAQVTIAVSVTGAKGNSEIREMVDAGVRQALSAYDKHLPNRVREIDASPRRR